MTSFTKKIGENIRLCRTFRKLSQENVADMLQITPTGYGKIERGESNITIARIEEIAKALSVSPIRLLTFCESAEFFVSGNIEEPLSNSDDFTLLFKKAATALNILADGQAKSS